MDLEYNQNCEHFGFLDRENHSRVAPFYLDYMWEFMIIPHLWEK